MASNLVVESPDFDLIEKRAGGPTRDALYLLWSVLNNEITVRSQTVKAAQDTLEGKALADAPAAGQNNYDTQKALTVTFTGSTNFNLTGFRNPVPGRVVLVQNTGSGTVTVKHNSASSDAANRIVTVTAGDKTIATGQTALFHYSQSFWRMASFV